MTEGSSAVPVVGLGVSAGGIEALETMFRATPADLGLAYVVIAHLAPGRASMMAEILQRFTAMPVLQARDGLALEPDRVYVNQGGATLSLTKGRLRVVEAAGALRERHPIDLFFGSLAEELGEKAVGVVLSGSGSDGTLGVKAIKERGGLTVAQGSDGSAPRHGGMPSSAIASGLVDLVLSAEEIGRRLAALGRAAEGDLAALESERVARAVEAICAVLRDRTGHDFSGYKEATFLRRVRRRMQVRQIDELESYVEALRADGDEPALLFRDLLIGVTSFFRDPEAFAALEREALGKLFEGKGAADAVRVWTPACATGEEAYSIAMLLHERASAMGGAPRVQVFASDIDEAALAVARTGRYPAALLQGVSPRRLARYFVDEGGGCYAVSREIRDLCVFAAHNVVRDPPFSRMDLISCRNLLIYMGGVLQSRLASVFHYALRPGGLLFLGTAENVAQHEVLFAPLDQKHRIFRRRDHVSARLELPLSPPRWRAQPPVVAQPGAASDPQRLRRAVELRVLERYAPAHVVVDREGQVLHYSARTGKYLEAASGLPSRQLDAMARKGLRLELRAALKEAAETGLPATRERVPVDLDLGEHVQFVRLRVEPMGDGDGEPLFLVLFTDLGGPVAQAAPGGSPRKPGANELAHLENELRETRERLQATVEEYETSLEELKSANEELVSVNEEMQSANEELETSKEEIQSVNEELQTVNAELNAKVEELNRANADLRNLFESTQVATIFLDRRLIIRSFTPASSAIFNLIPSDRGRPLTDIVSRLADVDLAAEVERTLSERKGHERRVSDVEGRSHYVMRVLPYRTAEDAIDGVLLTFVDVTDIARSEDRQRTLIAELNHRVRNMLAVVGAIALNTVQGSRSADEVREDFLGRIQAMAKAHSLVSRQEWTAVQLADLLRTQLEPYLIKGRERVQLEGPPVALKPNAAVAIGMVAHELATNALKYGALSAPEGRIEISWRRRDGQLELEWRETGGPPVGAPKTAGFGSTLVERQLRYELDARGELEFAPEGVRARLSIPVARLSGAAPAEGADA